MQPMGNNDSKDPPLPVLMQNIVKMEIIIAHVIKLPLKYRQPPKITEVNMYTDKQIKLKRIETQLQIRGAIIR